MESGDRPWIKKMVMELLALEPKGNIIVIDWRGGSSPPYTQAVANIRLVGSITAHLIFTIKQEYKLSNLNNFHIIGHSLGAHLAGYVGYTLGKEWRQTLGRISGLDPAEPHFSKTDPIVRLDRTDAKYVDVIHTNAAPFISGGLGLSEAVGHVDYFPNGGAEQPGCGHGIFVDINFERGSVIKGIRRFLGCNHIRSYEYFTESITTSCPFMSISCDSYEGLQTGECFTCNLKKDQHCLKFGYHSLKSYRQIAESGELKSSKPIMAYLMTGGHKPYCRVHYKVTVNISESTESMTHGGEVGTLQLTLRSHDGKDTEKMALSSGPIYYAPGTQHSVVVPGRYIPNTKAALLEWEYRTSVFNPLTWRLLASPRLYVAWITIESLEYSTSIKLCAKFSSPVVAFNPMLFQQSYCDSIQ